MRFFLRTLGLSLCLWTCHAVGAFSETFDVKGIYYETLGNSVKVVAGDDKYSGRIVIPDYVTRDGEDYPVTEICQDAFWDCDGLTEIVFPTTLRFISSTAFCGCKGLTEIVLPSSVQTVNTEAFLGCKNLKSVRLSESLTFLGSGSFAGCKNLTRVICPRQTPPNQLASNNGGFDSENYENAILYVPLDSKSNYANYQPQYYNVFPSDKPYWSFKHIVEMGNIVDGEAYAQDFDVMTKVRYTRNFKNTNWQPLYVPFSLPVETLAEYGLTVAVLNDTHQCDNDHDGVADETTLEFFTLPKGETQANYPYLIKANKEGEVVIELKSALIEAATESSIDCSTTSQIFTFVGTYDGISGDEMFSHNYYAMAGGGLKRPADSNVSLKPQRWYMKIENKDGSPVEEYMASAIRFSIDGMEEEDETSGIEALPSAESAEAAYYNLSGHRLTGRPASGLSIHQGKIVLIRQ